MAELEIDKEDVHDRKKWRKNAMKRRSNLIEKTDYKPIIIIAGSVKPNESLWHSYTNDRISRSQNISSLID